MISLNYTATASSEELEDLFGNPGQEDERIYFAQAIEGLHQDFSRAGICLELIDAGPDADTWAFEFPHTISPEALTIFKTTFGIRD